jgi:hypothetical protein
MQALTLDEAIDRLPLNLLAGRLAIPGEIPDRDGKTVRCFFPDRHAHGDRNPSFNFYDKLTRYKCHACGIQGRGPDLVALVQGLDPREGIRRFVEMAGGPRTEPLPPAPKPKKLVLPADLHKGTDAEILALASLRQLSPHALALADGMGVLRFGTVHGFPCWIVTDLSHRIAEARRMDGKPFPAVGPLGERKAHTLAGSDKSWPVGLMPGHSRPELFRRIAIVEGGPDLLAAYHFLLEEEECGTLPVAILGRNCSAIHPDAISQLRTRTIRLFPHADEDGGGMAAARGWGVQVLSPDCPLPDAFDFSQLCRKDSLPINDLNDCVHICEADKPKLKGLFA